MKVPRSITGGTITTIITATTTTTTTTTTARATITLTTTITATEIVMVSSRTTMLVFTMSCTFAVRFY